MRGLGTEAAEATDAAKKLQRQLISAEVNVEDLETKLAGLRAVVGDLQNKFTTAELSVENLTVQLAASESKNKGLQAELQKKAAAFVPENASQRVLELEDELARLQGTAFVEKEQIALLTTALEKSAAALDSAERFSLKKHETVSFSGGLTVDEHGKLVGALEASAAAQREAQEALNRSTADNVNMRIKCVELAKELESVLGTAKQDSAAQIPGFEQEIIALRAEKEAAIAREKICQAELEHMRQRRSAGAAVAYTDLLAANESLQEEVDELEDALRRARSGNTEESSLVEPLLREIESLKSKYEEARARHVASLERHIDDATSGSYHQDGSAQSGAVQEVYIAGSNVRQGGVVRRRRRLVPQQTATSRLRPNVKVRIDNTPGAAHRGVGGMTGWLRFNRQNAEFLSMNNEVLCSWQASDIVNPRRVESRKVAFNTNRGLVRVSVSHPKLAVKVEAELAVLR